MMRVGRKHQPFYRVVVVPRTQKPGRSKVVEKLGWVDPLHHKKELNAGRVKYWIGVGAQPSDTAWNLFAREGLVEGEKRKKGKSGLSAAASAEEGIAKAADSADLPAEASAKEGATTAKEEPQAEAPVAVAMEEASEASAGSPAEAQEEAKEEAAA